MVVLGMLSIRIARYKNILAWPTYYSDSERELYKVYKNVTDSYIELMT